MGILRMVESDLVYARKMVGAGWDGIASARKELNGEVFTSASKAAGWTPTAIGAGLGMLSSHLIGKRRSASSVAMGGLIGSVVGFGAGVAWGSRRFTGTAARKSIRLMTAVRDARWLERNPIDYA